jgi:hypothetical protein
VVQKAPINRIVYSLLEEFQQSNPYLWDSMEGFWKF